MGNYAIKVEDLGKRYRIGERQKYKALRDVLTDAVYAPVRAAGRLLHGGRRDARPDSTIWALKDMSFQVAPGEVLGVIGRNGAGKSTLLKILSRITEPTEGEARLRGRLGSLLEVGTGFHPELTGRENIYLNGAIIGMKRAEIERKFDDIVAFAELEKFLDTPVKHYSSGMYVRLAFAVAAHLEPEILLVDEVLAVGDAAFQKKCLGKMGQVAGTGRTVLFVSHNMMAVEALCQQAMWIEAGRIKSAGSSHSVVTSYLNSFLSAVHQMDRRWTDTSCAPATTEVRIARVFAQPSPSTHQREQPVVSEDLALGVEFWCPYPQDLAITLHVVAQNRVTAFATSTMQSDHLRGNQLQEGLYRAQCVVPANLLNTGTYWVRVVVMKNQTRTILVVDDALSFEMFAAPERWVPYLGNERGVLAPLLHWQLEKLQGPVV